MLTFVGLGLYDERCVTLAGRDAIRRADRVFLEWYTSRLVAATPSDLEAAHGIAVEVTDRAGIEDDPGPILDASDAGDAVLATAGDPMIATTHVDLRLRAHEAGIRTRLIHGPTAAAAAVGLTGLQHYRFGKAVTVPFPHSVGGEVPPPSVVDTIRDNRERGLHTLAFLDIDAERERFMSASEAASALADPFPNLLGVVVARAGSPDPLVRADRLDALANGSFGGPLHLLVIPGDLHHMEREALSAFANAPPELLD